MTESNYSYIQLVPTRTAVLIRDGANIETTIMRLFCFGEVDGDPAAKSNLIVTALDGARGLLHCLEFNEAVGVAAAGVLLLEEMIDDGAIGLEEIDQLGAAYLNASDGTSTGRFMTQILGVSS